MGLGRRLGIGIKWTFPGAGWLGALRLRRVSGSSPFGPVAPSFPPFPLHSFIICPSLRSFVICAEAQRAWTIRVYEMARKEAGNIESNYCMFCAYVCS